MDGYGYTTKGYTTYNGIEPCSGGGNDGWNKPSSGHVCRPVIVDAEGRKQPIIWYTPTTHKTETCLIETYVEHVAVMPPVIDHVPTTTTRTNPMSTVFRRLTASNSPTKSYNNTTTTIDGDYDDYNDYNSKKNGGARDGYYRLRGDDSAVHEQPMVTNHGGRDGYYRRKDDNPVVHEQTKLTNHGGRDGCYRRKDDDPVYEQPKVTNHGGRDGCYRRKDDDPVHEQPTVTNHGGRDRYYRRKDDDPVIHKQPMATNHGGRDGYYRRDDPVVHKQPMVTNHGGREGYHRRDDPVVHKQPMVTNHGGGRDGYYRRKDDDPVHEQPMVTNQGGWTRTNRDGWSAPPPSHDSSLTNPMMTEITKAIEYLKEAERRWST